MNKYSSARAASLWKCLARILGMSLLAGIFAVGVTGQIRIGNIKVPIPNKTEPKNPPPPNPTTTSPNPNTNRTPTTNGSRTGSTRTGNSTSITNVETGATREQVDEFLKDMSPYREGMNSLKWWSKSTDSIRSGCGEVKSLRRALTEGAAFHEIVKQKYPGIENPSGATHPNSHESWVGDFRRFAENREAIVKKCVNGLMDARLQTEIAGINSAVAEFEKREGYVLGRDSFDKAARHAALMERWKENYAEVGLTMPDDSVFADYDAAHERLIALANQNVGKWVFPPTERDPMIEAKARGWLKDADPKATVVKIGMLHGEWQVNHHSSGVPSGRYKRGYVMFRMPGVQNCLVNNFSYEQNYIGGGRFNAQAITSGMSHSLRLQTCK